MKFNKSHFALNIGTLLEYYDFVIFSMLAKSIMESLFPSLGENSTLLHFLFFSLGGVFRLIGGILFGGIGDFFGRRKTFLYITISMSVATFAIGVFPSMQSPILNFFFLFSLRAVQSISFGGEISGASTFTYETEKKSQRGPFLGIVFSGATIGAVFATSTLSFLTFILSSSQMISWGWRIPFILGSLIGFFSLFLRRSLKETTPFMQMKEKPHKKFSLLKRSTPTLLLSISLFIFPLSLGMLNIYFSFYFSTHLSISLNLIYSTQTVGLIASIFIAPLAGWLTKFFSLERLLLTCFLSFSFLSLLLINLAINATYLSLSIFFIIWQLLLTPSIVWSMLFTLDKLPVEIRTTSLGIAYNFSAMLAGFVPTLISALYGYFNNYNLAFYIASFIGLFSAGSLILSKNNH